ncbi:MAG: DNA adenine methylase [Chloroflexota bacterium]|nr:DNA adenine methylase [Chloroflexota bacterium]
MQPKNWLRHLRRCSAKLQGVQILCADFAQIIEQAPDGAFLFVDPPYFNADQDKFYTYSFTHADHLRLAAALHAHSHRLSFLLTYDNSPEVRALYGWAALLLDKEWNYTISRTDDQTKKTTDRGKRSMGREVFILNYDPAAAVHRPVAVQLPLVGLATDLAVASSRILYPDNISPIPCKQISLLVCSSI